MRLLKEPIMVRFPFLIGKVLTSPAYAGVVKKNATFPFLIGKVLTPISLRIRPLWIP